MSQGARVDEAFGPTGALAAGVLQYQPRPGQLQMARAVAETVEQGGVLVVEAGTGVGKTYAYLLPLLLSGGRALVSTATKALQDQLFGRDIPQLRQLLGLPLRAALLKGRSSYLCLQRMEEARQDARLDERRALQQLARLEHWSLGTHSGDLAEVEALDEGSPLLPLVTSTRENCLGARCPKATGCFVNRARREALAADLVVINHHLFFADLNVRESGVAELLPSVHSMIFDEAHLLNEIGVQFLGRQLGTGQLSSFARDLLQLASAQAPGLAPWAELAAAVEQGSETLRGRFPSSERAQRMDWRAAGPRWPELLLSVAAALQAVQAALELVVPTAPSLQALLSRAQELQELLGQFAQPEPGPSVRWLEVGRQVRMLQSPLDVAQALQTRVLPPPGTQSRKSWVFTSATLGQDESLSWMVDSCGLAGARVLRVPSPFDYARQAALYIPTPFPKPVDTGHSEAVAALALHGAIQLGGRTLVLTTTLRALSSIGDSLARRLGQAGTMQLLLQGAAPKRELLQRFAEPGPMGAILVASASFWEGIDLPDQALRLLVIDKLPFTPPDDPVLQARARALEAQGKSAFKQLHVPQAAVALRQGAGRLIRRETDRGVLVVCDVRLAQMGYGRQLLAALPPMRRLHSAVEFEAALQALTTASTTDRYSSSDP